MVSEVPDGVPRPGTCPLTSEDSSYNFKQTVIMQGGRIDDAPPTPVILALGSDRRVASSRPAWATKQKQKMLGVLVHIIPWDI